jgi:hypothetical protein
LWTSIFTIADIAEIPKKIKFSKDDCVESFLKDYTQSSFKNIFFTRIFAMSASGQIDVIRSFKKYQLDGLFKTNCLIM